ncbi:MAG: hypothetical protein V1856_00430 [Candidatus Liptonbacteria bacterium]
MTAKEVAFVRNMRELGVLEEIAGHRLQQENGVILVTCADGDQFSDIFRHQQGLMSRNVRGRNRIHVFSWNGGPLRIAANSPANTDGSTFELDAIQDIRDASAMKGIRTVVLCAHAPCGKAHAHNVSVEETIRLLIAAQRRLKQEVSELTVADFFHVRYPDDMRARSYFVNAEKWAKRFAARN